MLVRNFILSLLISLRPPINTISLLPFSQSKKNTDEAPGTNNNSHTDIENTKNITNDEWNSVDNIDAKRSRNRERIKSSVDWSAHGRNPKHSRTKTTTPTITIHKDIQEEDYIENGSKNSDRGDRTGRFGETPNNKKTISVSKYRDQEESDSEESLEEEDYITRDSKKPHVENYQSLRKITLRLSTVKEETFEEGMTSLIMNQDPIIHSRSFTSGQHKTRKSNQGLLSLGLLKNKTDLMDRGERSPPNSRARMLFSRDRTESHDGTETENTKTIFKPEIVIEDKLEQSFEGNFEFPLETRQPILQVQPLKMESSVIDSFCCRWNNSPRGKRIRHSESCNIF